MQLELLVVAALCALGVVLLGLAINRTVQRRRMRERLRTAGVAHEPVARARTTLQPRVVAGRLGAWLARHVPGQVGSIASRTDRAGLAGRVSAPELLGWKIVGALLGLALGAAAVVRYGTA